MYGKYSWKFWRQNITKILWLVFKEKLLGRQIFEEQSLLAKW